MYHVHLIDAIPEQEIEKLQGEYFKIIDDLPAEGIVIRSTKVKDEWLTPDLLAISRAGVGVNTINVEKASENGTIVMNTPGVNANAVKELVLCCLLLSSRPIIEASRMVQTLTGPNILEQAENKRSAYVGRELQGKTIGLLGLGAIGTKVALSCYSLGMDVLGYSIRDAQLDYVRQADLETVLSTSDYIVVMLPLTEDTKGLIDQANIEKMKKDAVLINVGRSEIVDKYAVMQALEKQHLAKYVTDFPEEEFLENDRILMLPHLGGSTQEALADSGRLAVEALKDYLLFGTVREAVNYPSARMFFQAPFRFTIFYQKKTNILAEIFSLLNENELAVADISRNHKNEHVYILIDIDSTAFEQLNQVKQQLEKISGVRKVRLLKKPERP
ncbi:MULTISPECIES: NAD(P)-dependent oxidoreductase [Enterococcus]|uniref:NAD(P)-dependent oxidoreductase n=1 Tax=Enterococcus TaxID=1350 RepID=UPI00215B9A4C|nr:MULTISPECIES: NAD(P)-dependent oxidoreductase [Enterococcus]MCR9045628.1 NAD(P)-binding domain-containing protein [Enterococcus faecium]MDQ8604737.1 NAD(P)-dependent oxidoreductase [Enterococcus sp. FR202]MDQ8615224.1 NAD(P)-dependent oxidoreductase [Enterococcus sp. FR165]MDQ8627903.1 NAD(P)-dependent oxidoreductase [Enterococcus sp. FR204]MDQ8646913.1 NAD(P)-dependent oxidoreductase [Enterococcus sp. FR208]